MMAHDHTDSLSQNQAPLPYENQKDSTYSSIFTVPIRFRSFYFLKKKLKINMYIKKLINSNSLLKQQTKIKKYFPILKKK